MTEPTPPSGSSNGRAAIVCDDDPLAVEVASMVLKYAGFAVVATADSGAALVRALAEASPELLILDHDLPDATSGALIPVVHRAAPDCRVIVFSARWDLDHEEGLAFAHVLKQGTEDLTLAVRRAAADIDSGRRARR